MKSDSASTSTTFREGCLENEGTTGSACYWHGLSGPSDVVADFTGRCHLYSMYLNAYIARYGHGEKQVQNALTEPTNEATINDLVSMVNACAGSNFRVNPCAAGLFHDRTPDGMMEPIFSGGFSDTDMGFSERSFYFELLSNRVPTVIPIGRGVKTGRPQHLPGRTSTPQNYPVATCGQLQSSKRSPNH